MSLDSAEIVVGANGSVNVAPFGTALPTDIDAALHANFIELGYVTEDGATFTDSKTVGDIKSWQSFYPTRKLITARDAMVKFVLQQWNLFTVPLAFGGGAVTTTTNGFKYTPPDPETIDERSLVLDWQDGTKNYRLVLVKSMVTENVETQLVRTKEADLPITLGLIGTDGVEPWYFLTDDVSLGAAASAS